MQLGFMYSKSEGSTEAKGQRLIKTAMSACAINYENGYLVM